MMLVMLPWSGIFFKLARCGYALRVTSQATAKAVTVDLSIFFLETISRVERICVV